MTSNNFSSRNADSETRPLLSRVSTLYDDEVQQNKQTSNEETRISIPRGIAIGVSIFVLIFTLTYNVTLMTTIQSPIAEEFNASNEVIWFNAAFLIAVTSLTPISGRLCQIFTPSVYLLASIIVQAIGLLITSQAPDTPTFLTGRAVCGMGSAAVTPVAFILVAQLTPTPRRGVFFGLINTGYTSGLACGAVIAGALEPVVGWRSIFWMQIPLTVTAAFVAFSMIPRPSKSPVDPSSTTKEEEETTLHKLKHIDLPGILTLTLTLVTLLYTLSAPTISIPLLFLSLICLLLFLLFETRYSTAPIVPPVILRSRANILSGLATVGIMTARWSILFYTPVYAITVHSLPPARAGALLIPTNLGFALGGLIIGGLHIRRSGSFYLPTLLCFVLFAAIQLLVSLQISRSSSLVGFIVTLFFNGFVVGALLNYSLAHLLHLTPASQHVIVIPFNATFRSFSGSFGSAICGGFFLRTLSANLTSGFEAIGLPHKGELVHKLLGSPLLVQKLEGDERDVAVDAYVGALRATFLGGVGLAIVMLTVQSGVGWRPLVDEEEERRKEDRERARDGDEIQRVVSRESGPV